MPFANRLGELVEKLFSADCGHVSLQLRKLKQARLLWLNPEIERLDDSYCGFRTKLEYESMLISQCAFVVPESVANEDSENFLNLDYVVGIADRYGGFGIGRNGGSGRNVSIGKYAIKGCGRTPLIGQDTDFSHASGGAYHEECVREAVYSEVVRKLFPKSAVPVFAIIDTGLNQEWPEPIQPNRERRVLLVRPAMIRPAHFERATFFNSGHPLGGIHDQKRVANHFKILNETLGREEIEQAIKRFVRGWAQQISFGFANRLLHGNNTSSNISVQSKLLDFGAASAVPSWSRFSVSEHPDSFSGVLGGIEAALRSLCYFVWRNVTLNKANLTEFEDWAISTFHSELQSIFYLDCLQALGIDRQKVERSFKGCDALKIRALTMSVFYEFQSKIEDLRVETFEVHSHQFDQIWANPTTVLQKKLRKKLATVFSSQEFDKAVKTTRGKSHALRNLMRYSIRQSFFSQVGCEGLNDVNARYNTERFVESILGATKTLIN